MFVKSALAGMMLAVFTMQPAQAAMECNAQEISRLETAIEKLSDGPQKTVAKREMALAKQMMAEKDLKSCSMHLDFSEQTVFNRG